MDQLADATLRRTLGERMDQREQIGKAAACEDHFDRFIAKQRVVQLFANRPARRQAEFQGEAACDLNEIAVERADTKSMQAADGGDQQIAAALASQLFVANRLGQLLSLRFIVGSFREAQEDAVEDFARRFASECGGENFIGPGAAGQEADEAIRQLIGLSRAGAGADDGVRKARLRVHAASPSVG